MREFSLPALYEVPTDGNLTDLIRRNAAQHPDVAVLGRKVAGVWTDVTATEFLAEVRAAAKGLIAAGIAPGDRVALMSRTRFEWVQLDFAIWSAGAITVPVYETSSAEQVQWILGDSGAVAVIVESDAHTATVESVRDALPGLLNVWQIEKNGVDELTASGAGITEATVDERAGSAKADDPATIVYTSGTTGRPKGVRLTHDSWSYMAKATVATGLIGKDDVQYLWLPLAHVFGKMLTSGQIEVGHVTAVDGRVDKIIENLPVVRPTYMAAVPRIFEKVYNGVAAKARAGGPAKYKIFKWAADIARESAKVSQDNFRRTGTASLPLGLAAKHKVADALVYTKLREAFGGRLRAAVSGSASLAPDIGYFFSGAGIHILEGYGLTESSAASFVNPGHAYRTGTVGKPMPGTEVRIADDGEIMLRGPGIMQGYQGLPEKTAEVLEQDGWFHTGDIGELSPDGYLRITDRKKDLIKTSGGKYIAPAEVEGQFKAVCPFVSNILVYGADRNFCTALISLDEESILAWGAEHGLGGKSYAEVVAAERTKALIGGYVQRLNEGLQRWQTIKKFRLLPRDLDIEHGELTPSLKLKRPVVEREYRDLIEEMYAGSREA